MLMLGSVSQQHKILLDLIIEYTAKSELSCGFLGFCLVLFCFYSTVLILATPVAVEHSSRGLSHLAWAPLISAVNEQTRCRMNLAGKCPRENRHV